MNYPVGNDEDYYNYSGSSGGYPTGGGNSPSWDSSSLSGGLPSFQNVLSGLIPQEIGAGDYTAGPLSFLGKNPGALGNNGYLEKLAPAYLQGQVQMALGKQQGDLQLALQKAKTKEEIAQAYRNFQMQQQLSQQNSTQGLESQRMNTFYQGGW